MKIVKQRHKTGCGPACVATLCNVSYYDALQTIFPQYQKNTKRKVEISTNVYQLTQCINKLGLCCNVYKKFSWQSIKRLKKNVILQIKLKNGLYHWVIWNHSTQSFFDPSKKPPLTTQKYITAYKRNLQEFPYIAISL